MNSELEFVRNYLRKTGRIKTLKVLQDDFPKKTKLSFKIAKPPERKKLTIECKKNTKKTSKKQENKKREIPASFKKLAKKFGLPEQHLDFFYEHRDDFQWETISKREINCIIKGCSFSAPVKPGALVNHMIEEHAYGTYPCDQPVCNFVTYSISSLRKHLTQFHGNGKRHSSKNNDLPCSYCSFYGQNKNLLDQHVRIHENRQVKCQFCDYTSVNSLRMQEHMLHHFKVRNYPCDQCERSFFTRAALNNHIRIHSNDYNCLHCSKPFKTRRTHDVHVTSCTVRLSKFSL
ncbi:unnamed protein product [Oikopleura dioica]|uniref:C2H2-type domain-containing protein n=1 Tax=Oikopleura dioica TaxID=34765 RepID=E4XLJ3_OIKDI|nr:unnamed protein product [Oikopleura dioica]CBY39508.1 unnamed protein product [Oikopleura dioica]